MYKEHFGLREAPFSITPDPRYVYMSLRHQEALAHLLYGTGEDGGFVQLTGEVGTGKTTLVRVLLEQELGETDFALILNPRLTLVEFVATICDELGVGYPTEATTLKPLIDSLNRHLLRSHGKGRQTVVIVDEAQNLVPEVLEQVRLLTNLETAKHKLLRIILVGQPELNSVLSRHDMRQLAQRITARYHLNALSRSEVAAYVAHRLRVAGGRGDTFTSGALRQVHARSGGIPRLINVICDRSLLGAYTNGAREVDARNVRKAAREALGDQARTAPVQGWRVGLAASLAALVTAAAAVPLLKPEWVPWKPSELLATLGFAETSGDAAPQPMMAAEGDDPRDLMTFLTPADSGLGPSRRPETELASGVAGPRVGLDTDSDPGTRHSPLSDISASLVLDDGPRQPGQTVAKGQSSSQAASALAFHEIAAVLTQLPVSSDAVFGRLFALWGEEPSGDGRTEPCIAAYALAMRCLEVQAAWHDLLKWNLPAVIWLRREGDEPRPVLLVELMGEVAQIDFGNGPRPARREDLDAFWTGRTALLWRLEIGSALIGMGSTGEPLRWLHERLNLATGLASDSGQVPTVFDASLHDRVLAFQRANDLVADGIVGQYTIIALNNIAPLPGTPRLVP